MNRLLVAVLLVTFAVAPSLAADSVVLKAKNGAVTFNHKMHSEKFDCKTCHGEAAPGKMTLDKNAAHKLCKGCHQEKGQGPTKCRECHKK